MTRFGRSLRAALGILVLLAGGTAAPGATRPHVVATTTLLASLATEVAGDRAEVDTLVPLGASPETYQPSPRDTVKLHAADLVFENGVGLEAWLDSLLRAVAGRARIVVCSDGLRTIDGNPHLWLDPQHARAYVARMRDALVALDPADADAYRRNAKAFDARLVALDARIRARIATVPADRRNMIVFHNAWPYYNARYGLRTLGVIEENPGTEPSAEHLARLVDLARANHVRTLFAELEYSPKLMQAVARSAGIATIAVLYDDSVGTSPATRDYVAMLDTDTDTIVAGLR
jgi:ABC-type Zn uptake system ZnuABC Zn-binding protein ZnuA